MWIVISGPRVLVETIAVSGVAVPWRTEMLTNLDVSRGYTNTFSWIDGYRIPTGAAVRLTTVSFRRRSGHKPTCCREFPWVSLCFSKRSVVINDCSIDHILAKVRAGGSCWWFVLMVRDGGPYRKREGHFGSSLRFDYYLILNTCASAESKLTGKARSGRDCLRLTQGETT